MVTTLPASQATYIATVIGLVTLLMNGIAALLELVPAMKANSNLYNWTLRAINMALSFLGVCAAELTLGTFDLHNWVAYILATGITAGGSTSLYALTVARQKAKIASLTAQVATATPAPDGKNDPVTFQPAQN